MRTVFSFLLPWPCVHASDLRLCHLSLVPAQRSHLLWVTGASCPGSLVLRLLGRVGAQMLWRKIRASGGGRRQGLLPALLAAGSRAQRPPPHPTPPPPPRCSVPTWQPHHGSLLIVPAGTDITYAHSLSSLGVSDCPLCSPLGDTPLWALTLSSISVTKSLHCILSV